MNINLITNIAASLMVAIGYFLSHYGLPIYGEIIMLTTHDYKNNITFNCVSPGPVKSKKNKFSKKWIEKNIPTNRLCEVSDIINLIIFLSSDSASFLNGLNIKVDGGQSNSV